MGFPCRSAYLSLTLTPPPSCSCYPAPFCGLFLALFQPRPYCLRAVPLARPCETEEASLLGIYLLKLQISAHRWEARTLKSPVLSFFLFSISYNKKINSFLLTPEVLATIISQRQITGGRMPGAEKGVL